MRANSAIYDSCVKPGKSRVLGLVPICLLTTWLAVLHGQAADDRSGHLPEGAVQHVVVCWLKEPGNSAARARLIEACQVFLDIPGVLDVQAGPPLASDRPVVDDSFDVALIITFESEQALRDYLPHPLHRQVVDELVKPLVERFIVYDFLPQP